MSNEHDFLMHFGIKGQRWGVRRFQNEDGTLTIEGKTRYGRGREYNKELSKYHRSEMEKLQKRSKEYQKAKEESDRLLKKYGLDADDGGGGYTTLYSDDTLHRAGTRYFNLSEDMDSMNEKFSAKASATAKKMLIKKYGQTSISDINHYHNVNTGIGLGVIAALTAIPLASKLFKK